MSRNKPWFCLFPRDPIRLLHIGSPTLKRVMATWLHHVPLPDVLKRPIPRLCLPPVPTSPWSRGILYISQWENENWLLSRAASSPPSCLRFIEAGGLFKLTDRTMIFVSNYFPQQFFFCKYLNTYNMHCSVSCDMYLQQSQFETHISSYNCWSVVSLLLAGNSRLMQVLLRWGRKSQQELCNQSPGLRVAGCTWRG